MKKSNVIIVAVVMVVAIVAMVGASFTALADSADAVASQSEVKVAHISDIHVMIEEYCNIYSPAYQAAGNTSYKVLEQTEAAVEAVFDEMIYQFDASGVVKVDAQGDPLLKPVGDIPLYVFVTGDLTSNGELADHLGVARLFTAATAKVRGLSATEGYESLAGFQIFAIPGNHDIDNQNSKAYSPAVDDADWQEVLAAADADEMRAYLASLGTRSVQTTTMLEFMSIYSDFGYCNCEGRKEGVHEAPCQMADGVSLEYFYESDYWYEDGITRSTRPQPLETPVYLAKNYDAADAFGDYIYSHQYAVYDKNGDPSDALTEVEPTAQEIAGYKVDKDMEYYARASRHGACSYIARVGNLTVLGIDANSHKWTGVKEGDKLGVVSSCGWHETTGGYVTEAQLNWLIDSLRKGGDVADHRLVLSLAHENVLPHFDTEDEVISLFCYDNWEDVYTNMADNGIRYVFTGHQHTNDIESEVSQAGSVFYDFETGSTTCMGSGWRDLTFQQTYYQDGGYAEDAWSTLHFLHFNAQEADQTVFAYERYEVSAEGEYAKVKAYQKDADGNYQDLADYMALSLKKMIANMAGNIVNENLMDTLRGYTTGLQNSASFGFLYPVVDKVLDDLAELDLYQFVAEADGSFSLSAEPKAGYHLTQFALDLVDYFLGKDYSFDRKLGVYLDDVLLYVYGNHLVGGQHHDSSTVPDTISSLLEVMESGQFLRFVEDLLYRGVLPEVELILNAPIYWGDAINYRHLDQASTVTADDVKNGKGFDLSAVAGDLFNSDNTYVALVKTLIEPRKGKLGQKAYVGMDVSSLMKFVRSLPDVFGDLLSALDMLSIDVYGLAQDLLGRDIHSYVDLALGYIGKLDAEHTLSTVIKEELLDKYVTDAFCVNLGSYGAYIVRSVVIDDSVDGVERNGEQGVFPYSVTDNFHVELTYAGDKSAMRGHTYYMDADGNDTVKVVATQENGLLPSKITLGNVIDDEGNLDVGKKQIRWFTQRDVDYSTPEATCKQYEWSEAGAANARHYYSELQLADNAAFEGATITRYEGKNVWIEYPTIDLGITYINMTYAYRQYNDFDVVLEGLRPDATYYYRLRAVDSDAEGGTKYDWTPTYHFTTPKASGGFGVMAMTDIQGSIEANYTASLPNMLEAVKGNPYYVISCGDNVDKGENIAQWGWLLDDQSAVWANYAFSGVVGNHEDHHFSQSYVTATPQVAVVDETGFYYSYNYQNVHFVMLNTNDLSADKTLGEAQYAWLQEDLQKANANTDVQFIVVVMHKGLYTAGSHAFDADVVALRAQLAPLFATNNVDVVLQGHDHTYSVSQYIGATADENGKYLPVDVRYDATGAAVDPSGVLYVNLGTMGDKYYNYIYSGLVSLKDRAKDDYINSTFASYVTAAGNFELSPVRDSRTVLPESPVYAYLNLVDGRLSLTTYTVIEGKTYVVDDIAITKSAATATTGLSVLGVSLKATDLDQLDALRLPVANADGSTDIYVGYRLADVLAADGSDMAQFKLDNATYDAANAYVVVAKGSQSANENTAPTVLIYQNGAATMQDASAASRVKDASAHGGLPTWAIVLIVVGAVALLAACAVCVVVLRKRKAINPACNTSAEADKDNSVPAEEAASFETDDKPNDEE